jgi:hypothetical protein
MFFIYISFFHLYFSLENDFYVFDSKEKGKKKKKTLVEPNPKIPPSGLHYIGLVIYVYVLKFRV